MVVRFAASTLYLVSALLCACGGGDFGPAPDANPGVASYVTVAPDNLGDGWPVSVPATEGMSATSLTAALQAVQSGRYPKVDAVVIARNGRLVAEGYFNGFARESVHDLRSASKSITSALAGIAIDQQLLTVDDLMSAHFPGFESYPNVDDRKRAITVFNLLNMNTGLECNDWDSTSRGNEERMYGATSWVDFMLGLRMAHAPGEVAAYCTGSVILLGQAVANRSSMRIEDFAQANLFGPLGITNVTWRRSPDGLATGGGGMRLRPRDLAKFGALFANGGVWNGSRVISQAWVAQSRRRVTTLGSDGYGFLWWKRSFTVNGVTQECFFASGNGGNYVFVLPALQLVVAFTGSNYDSPAGDQPFRILSDQILLAVN
jgi:CubicO group peptidase (beta-lactamase class C family)